MRRPIVVSLLLAAMLPACDGDTPNQPTAVASSTPVAPTPTPTPVPTPTPMSISGEWRSEARSWDIRLEQSGSSLRGVLVGFKNQQYSNLNDPALQVRGTMNSAGAVEFHADAFELSFSGTAEAGGARMTGTLHDCVQICRNYGEVLTRK
jgi:hypothetical protein